MAKRHQNSVRLAKSLSLVVLITLVLSVCAADWSNVHARQWIGPTAPPTAPPAPPDELSPYARQFIGPVGLGGGAGEDVVNFTEDTTTLLYNPNVGLVSNNAALGSTRTNPNGYPIPIMETRYYWRDLESSRDTYTFSTVQTNAIQARADLQTFNTRLPYIGNVGDCGATYSDPTWMTDADLSGWTATHDECGSPAYNYMNLEDTDVITEFTELLTAAESALSLYPAWRHGFLETGYGAYGENNFSGTICSTTVGAADACSGGSEIAQYTIGEISPWYDAVHGVTTSIRKMNMVDNEDLFDYIYDNYTGTAGGTRADCWGWQEAATANCPTTGPWMCGIYPRTFAVTSGSGQTASHSDQDLTGMIFLEACGSLSTWDDGTPYDYTASFQWALDNGGSALNVKGFYDGTSGMDTVMTTALRTLGYRYFLDEVRNADAVTAGNNLTIEIDVTNRGVAPDYDGMVWMVKLVEQGGGAADIYRYTTAETLKIAAGASITDTLTVPIPTWLDQANYDIYVGAGFDDNAVFDFPELKFAVTAAPGNRWYQAGVVAVTNAAPDANPVSDYGRDFEATGDTEYFAIPNHSTIQGQVYTAHAEFVLESESTTSVVVARGDVGGGAMEFSINYSNVASVDRIQCRFGSGGSVRTENADGCGAVTTGTTYIVTSRWNDSTKVITCDCNGSTDTSGAFSGSKNSASLETMIGVDPVLTGRYFDGKIGRVYLYNTRLSDTCAAELQARTHFADLSYDCRRGMIVAQDFEESSGNGVDSFQHWSFVETSGTIPQVSM